MIDGQKNTTDDSRIPIHIETIGLGPHGAPVIILPKNPNDKKYHTWVWFLATVIIGISVASFFYNTAINLMAIATGKAAPSPLAFTSASSGSSDLRVLGETADTNVLKTTGEKNMGSDDADTPQATSTPSSDGQYYFQSEDYKLPRTSAIAYLAADVDTGEVIIEKNPDMVRPIASVSKLTASLVSEDFLDQHEPVTVSRSSVDTYGTLGGLVAGEKILVRDLLYPLLMESSNDAAEVLAQAGPRADFIKKMNEKVKSLGMPSTFYDDPSGLSANNVSSVTDLFTLAKYITKEHPELWDITRVRQYSILSHSWINNNDLSRRTSFIGGKNGYTEEADRTTVTLFNVPVEKSNRRIVVIILKSDDRNGDVDAILRFIQSNVGFLPADSTTTPL